MLRYFPTQAFNFAFKDVIKNIFSWSNVIVFAGADSYSANGAAAFEEAALSQGITVSRSLQVSHT